MKHAFFRFYAELNDFLPPEARGHVIPYAFQSEPTVKEAIEALGVPHVEVELIVVAGESVDFGYRLQDGDRVAVYPVFESLDVSPVLRVRPEPLRRIAFVVDAHLGKLARLLRLLGFDTVHHPHISDRELVAWAKEGRILLTRDRELLKHGAVTHGYWVRSTRALAQAEEVVRRFDLAGKFAPFTRCLRCNGLLRQVPPTEGRLRAPPKVRTWCREYFECSSCGQLFWPGTHYPKLATWVRLLERV